MSRINNSKHFRRFGEVGLAPWESAPPLPAAIPMVRVPASLQRKRNAGKSKCVNEGRCRMCQRVHEVRPLTRHHLVPQQWFIKQPEHIKNMRNCDAVIVPLCRPCHDAVERHADGKHARRMLRRSLMQDEIAFCIAVRGKEWFDRRYPLHVVG